MMLEYLIVLLIGFWLGVAIFLYISCYWIEEILDLPQTPGGIPGPTASASSAHAQLKRLVARVVEEAAALPALARYAAEPHSPVESTYEDLLATAILNKVIERYQNENGSGGRSSGIHSASASSSPSERSSPRSHTSRSRRDIRDITPPLNEEDEVIEWEDGGADEPIELPRRVPFPEYGGDIIHPSENDFRDFDEVSGSDIQAVDGSWEENWLFQKKKINTIQSVPVPMLVPNSNTDYKALIGDRDADDTTDLSDNASEDEGEVEYKSDVKRVLDSKHIIGGQPKLDELDFEPDSLTIVNGNDSEHMLDSIENIMINEASDSQNLENKEIIHSNNDSHDSIMIIGVNSGPISKTEFNLKEEIHRTVENGDHDGFDDDTSEPYSLGADIKCSESSFTYTSTPSMNTLSRHEREGEYEETVTVPVQRYADSLRRKHFDVETDCQVSQDGAEDLIPGSIAYRERKKWLNFVDMPNNPYSPEAIQKRLSAKSTSSLFDSMTSKSNTSEVNNSTAHDDDSKIEPDSLDILEDKNELTKSSTTDCVNDTRAESPSPKDLKDVLSEEIPQYKRYGRDYYIKEAKSSSGGRKYNSYSETSSVTSSVNKSTSLDNFDTEFASPGLLIEQFNNIAFNQEYTKFADKEPISITTMPNEYKNEILIEYEDSNEPTLFSAKPANIDDDTDRQFEEILQSAYKDEKEQVAEIIDEIIEEAQKSIVSNEDQSLNEHQSIYSSSSLEDTIKIYNVQTGEIVKCEPEDNVSRYEASDENDNKLISDKVILGEDDKTCVSSETCVGEEAIVITELEEPEKKSEGANELSDIPTELPNVRELAKKFLSMENLNEPVKPSQNYTRRRKSKDNVADEKPGAKLNYMHSLTARSISKEFRDELKLSMATPLTVPGGAKEIPEGTDDVTRESSRPGSPVPEPGTIKSKLAFFEGLKSKFSSK